MSLETIVFVIVCLTSCGLFAQCLSNLKTRRAAFMAFPIALLIQLPYPLWAILAWLNGDSRLLAITLIMGLPTAWLSIQYFQFEWRSKSVWSIEDSLTLVLVVLGLVLFLSVMLAMGVVEALALTAAYLTCCISIFSYLIKIWRVARGNENLDGLKWSTLIPLAVFYAAMIYVGQLSDVLMLSVAYIFSVMAIALAIAYKAYSPARKLT